MHTKGNKREIFFWAQVRSVWAVRNRVLQVCFLQGGMAGCSFFAARRCIPALVIDANILKGLFFISRRQFQCTRSLFVEELEPDQGVTIKIDCHQHDAALPADTGHAAHITPPGRMERRVPSCVIIHRSSISPLVQ
jgi:hypothetical protein